MKKIVVIGSGLAGSLICNELVSKYEVTLLEAGSKDRIAYPRVEYIGKHFGAVNTFCIGRGGTTNIWDNGLIPVKPEDVSSDVFSQVLVEASAYADKAAARLYFSKKNYMFEYNTVLSEMSDVAKSIGVFPDGVDCLLYPKKHRGLLVSDKVNGFFEVTDIGFVVEKNQIVSITYTTGHKSYTINPDVVVLSAGALGTPLLIRKIFLAGGDSFDQVGTGLADHPMGFVGKIKVKKEFQQQVQQMVLVDKKDYIARTAVRLKSDCGNYTSCAFFRPALTMQNRLSIYKYKSLLGASSGADRIKNAFSIKLFHPDILAEIYSHLSGSQVKSRIFNILILFEQKRGNSRVDYKDGKIRIDWQVSESELNAYNRILEKLADMLRPVSDELIIKRPLTEDWLWSAAHHSGTVSLGDGQDDIIGRDLRLNGYDNVFVCDGSVIQEHSYANTGLTIGQLGMRLADELLTRH